MQRWRAWSVVVVVLVSAGFVGVSTATAAARPDGGPTSETRERAPAVGWQGYRGARLGMSLRRAGQVLGEPVRPPETCTTFYSVSHGTGGRTVSLSNQYAARRTVSIIDQGDRVRGPAGVREGMTVRDARLRLERAGHELRFRSSWNEAYGYRMYSAFATGPRGRVLVLRLGDQRVTWVRTAVDMRVARRAMRDEGGC